MPKQKDFIELISSGRTLTICIPYADSDDAIWTTEDVKVKVDIRSLLSLILPTSCMNDKDCCATRFCQEAGAAERKPALPMATKQPAKPSQEDIEFCCAGMSDAEIMAMEATQDAWMGAYI